MVEKSLEARVAALEGQLAGKTLEEHFREQSSLIDRLFVYRNAELEKKIDAKLDRRFAQFEKSSDAKRDRKFAEFGEKFDAKLESLESRLNVKLGAIQDAVRLILTRLS